MPTSYIIILSDSEDDYDNIPPTILLSDSDDESAHLEPMEEHQDPENVTTKMEESSEEEEEEEENPEEEEESEEEEEVMEDNLENEGEEEQSEQNAETESEEAMSGNSIPSPPTFQYNYTSGPRTIRTARKRVAIPYQRRTTSPESSVPTHDPYFNPASPTESSEQQNTKTWTWLPDTLKEWRKEEGFPTISEVGESSNARQDFPFTQEPPHHTVPLLVARMSSQDLRIEHIENNVMGIQGSGAGEVEDLSHDVFTMGQDLNGLRDQVTNLTEHCEDMGEATQEVMEKGQEYNSRTRSLESRMTRLEQEMSRIEGHLDRLSAIAAAAKEYEAIITKGSHLPKKD